MDRNKNEKKRIMTGRLHADMQTGSAVDGHLGGSAPWTSKQDNTPLDCALSGPVCLVMALGEVITSPVVPSGLVRHGDFSNGALIVRNESDLHLKRGDTIRQTKQNNDKTSHLLRWGVEG